MSLIIPPDTRSNGASGHIADHNNLADLATLLLQGSVYNVKIAPYSAMGNGVADDTSAINAAATAAAAAGGGVVFFPPGKYKITGPISYSSTGPVTFLGSQRAGQDNATTLGSACIHMTYAPGHALSVSNAQHCTVSDLDFSSDTANTAGTSADHVAVYLNGVDSYDIIRSHVFNNSGGASFNTGIQVVNGKGGLIFDVYVGAEVNGIWFDGTAGGAGMTIKWAQIGTTAGNGFGAIRMDNSAATLNLDTVYTYHSDNGLICLGSGNHPTFIYATNFQVNNSQVNGIYLQAGSQFWGQQVWISMAGVSPTVPTRGIKIDTGYQGWFYLSQSVIQGPSQDGIYIAGGQGHNISTTSFGTCGTNANNVSSDLSIATGVSNVTVLGCHFDVDVFNGLGGSNVPKAAISLPASGVSNIHLVGNMALASGYGTATLSDPGSLATKTGNIGF